MHMLLINQNSSSDQPSTGLEQLQPQKSMPFVRLRVLALAGGDWRQALLLKVSFLLL